MDFLFEPWPWYMAGTFIAIIMFSLIYFGENFGLSNNLRTICSAIGGGKYSDFFKIDWKKQKWNLILIIGTIIGGFLASTFLNNQQPIQLNPKTISSLQDLGFQEPGKHYLPHELFNISSHFSFKKLFILIMSGFFVGFGARYAGGCTSGHAISGLSHLQVPSLIAVIGFFIGGLIMTHIFIPIIF